MAVLTSDVGGDARDDVVLVDAEGTVHRVGTHVDEDDGPEDWYLARLG